MNVGTRHRRTDAFPTLPFIVPLPEDVPMNRSMRMTGTLLAALSLCACQRPTVIFMPPAASEPAR